MEITARQRGKKIWAAMFSVFILAFSSQPTLAVPMSFNISQVGFAGGGSVTGMFTGNDLNSDGVINSFTGELSAFMATWTGNGTVGAATWGLPDLIGLIYELGTGDIGDDALCCGTEGLHAINASGIEWNSGNGPGGIGAAPGGGIQDLPTGAFDTTPSLIQVSAKVPAPATLTLFALGLAGLGFCRRRRG